MSDLANLIWLTHPAYVRDSIEDLENGAGIDRATVDLLTVLYRDETFDRYTPGELQAAVMEAIESY